MLGLFRAIHMKVFTLFTRLDTILKQRLLRRGCHHHRWRKSLEKIQVLN